MADRESPVDRCAVAAAERGDDQLGTAFPASRILLVEQRAGWALTGLGGTGFDPATAARLGTELGRQRVRVLAIRRPGRTPPEQPRRWGFADCRPGSAGMVWGTFEAEAELLALEPDELSTRATDRRPVYAVCTHGTHDRCCAIEGRPVAAALALHCPDRVWECSHVGGDRFAANVLVLPTGQLYGRVTDAAALAVATEDGRVLPGMLRGQIGLPPAAQAAVVHAQRELGLTEAGAVRLIDVTGQPPATQRVRLALPGGTGTVLVERVTGSPARLTCRAGSDRVPISYRPLSLTVEPVRSGRG